LMGSRTVIFATTATPASSTAITAAAERCISTAKQMTHVAVKIAPNAHAAYAAYLASSN
jgi:hypothetical protein